MLISTKEIEKPFTLAGWQEITSSSLPCIGFRQEVIGFTPFTGRRRTISNPNGSNSNQITPPPPNIAHNNINSRNNRGSQAIPIPNQNHHQYRHRFMQHPPNNHQFPHLSNHRLQPSPELFQLDTDFEPVSSRLQSFLQSLQDENAATCRQNDLVSSPIDELESKTQKQQNKGKGNSKQCRSTRSSNRLFLHTSSQDRQRNLDTNDNIEESDLISLSEFDIPNMAYFTNNSPPISPSILPNSCSVSSSSIFSISPQDAAIMVKSHKKEEDFRSCFLLYLKLRPLFSDDVIPGACLRKLPRLINGIPLGAGFLSRDQLSGIKWRLIEGGHSMLTFISCPMQKEEAEENKKSFKDRLVKQAQLVFGDMIIKVSVVLTECVDYDEDFVVNDIAVNLEEGLHFRD